MLKIKDTSTTDKAALSLKKGHTLSSSGCSFITPSHDRKKTRPVVILGSFSKITMIKSHEGKIAIKQADAHYVPMTASTAARQKTQKLACEILQYEAQILQTLRSPYIVSLIQTQFSHDSYNPEHNYMTIKCYDIDLLGYLKSNPLSHDKINNILRLALHTIKGIDYLSCCRIIHCNIHTQNVLFNEKSNRWVISDFKNAVKTTNKERHYITKIIRGREIFQAPEILQYQHKTYHTASDIFAWGIMLNYAISHDQDDLLISPIAYKTSGFKTTFFIDQKQIAEKLITCAQCMSLCHDLSAEAIKKKFRRYSEDDKELFLHNMVFKMKYHHNTSLKGLFHLYHENLLPTSTDLLKAHQSFQMIMLPVIIGSLQNHSTQRLTAMHLIQTLQNLTKQYQQLVSQKR
ncbi:MAG: protein kinase family protein [Endozoicomonadaceae bacterium]|nr:protein kinase family protein [Endozoicomonadaceae bacterium]